MRRCLVFLAVLAGCYSPSLRDGAPCESDDQCPSAQTCRANRCASGEAEPVDAAPEPPPDAAIDAPPPPPPIDAPPLACSTAGLNCPGGQVAMAMCGGKCWVRCTANLQRGQAQLSCTNWQGALGAIDDAAEQNCVDNLLANLTWLGLIQNNQATQPGMGWTWNDATQLVYTNWAEGRPDDGNGIEGQTEQCATMGQGGRWDDNECGQAHDFFCERP